MHLAPALVAKVEEVLKPFNGKLLNGLKPEQAGEAIETRLAQAEVMYCSDMTAERFLAAKKLDWIHIPFVGVNRLLAIKELVESQVTVTNGRGVIASSVADQVLAFVLDFARQMPQQWAAQQRGEWVHVKMRDSGLVDELAGKTMGIIGYGEIGREIGKRAKAFDMRVIATRNNIAAQAPYLDQALPTEKLPELLAHADFVVVTAPLTPETKGMIGAAELALMKPSAYLINIARGQLVKEAELIEVLTAGKIAGAGLDVFEQEPLPADSPLWKLPNVLLTPHTAGLFKRMLPRMVEFFCVNLGHYLNDEPLENIVDKKRGY